MKDITLQKAAAQFGNDIKEISTLGNGLIHHTFKASLPNGAAIVLQCINQTNFKQPENIIQNYLLLQQYITSNKTAIPIPALLPAKDGRYYWIDEEDNFWRATMYMQNSYTVLQAPNAAVITKAARCFAAFTQSLAYMAADKLYPVIPDFHNLNFRYQQFETAIQKATIQRLLRATHVISELRNRLSLVNFYNSMLQHKDFIKRVMHHDCKISNILFSEVDDTAICPVDLDTVMPGYFFSDLGDMIRTMSCTEDENSVSWETIDVNEAYYNAVVEGYLEGAGATLSAMELQQLHKSGLLMTFMQCMRFTTDFLNNDIYYKTDYPEQNLNRALNQLIYLEKLEDFVHTKQAL